MASVYLNPPHDSHPFQLAEQEDEQHLQLLHSSNRATPSLSFPFSLKSSTQDQRMGKVEYSQLHDQKVDHCIAHGGSRDLQSSNQPKMNSITNNKLPLRKRGVGEGSTSDNGSSSAKWISSKMRLMQKMINSSNSTGTDESVQVIQKLQDNNEVTSCKNTIRVCSDCNTTTTPLWRGGPRGPKSLCNACGIRQRKARKAMEAAAGNGTIAAIDSSFTKIKLHIKDKKPRTSHEVQYKKHCKSPESDPPHECQSQRKLCFKDFTLSLSNNSALKQVFPQDVEEAAILLMELSCGFIHS